jgi:hypothetical protein
MRLLWLLCWQSGFSRFIRLLSLPEVVYRSPEAGIFLVQVFRNTYGFISSANTSLSTDSKWPSSSEDNEALID